jgi:hypothetical protein
MMQQHTPGGTMMPMQMQQQQQQQQQHTPGGTLMHMQQQPRMGGGGPMQQHTPGGTLMPQQQQQQRMHTPGGTLMQQHRSPAMQPGPGPQNGGGGGDPCSFANLEGRSVDACVHALYKSFPEVCSETGRRFSTKQQLQVHKDKLFQKKQAAADGDGGAASRTWFDDSAVWLGLKPSDGDGQEDDDEEQDDFGGSSGGGGGGGGGKSGGGSADVLPWEEGLDSCPICGEDFDKYWDDDGASHTHTHTAQPCPALPCPGPGQARPSQRLASDIDHDGDAPLHALTQPARVCLCLRFCSRVVFFVCVSCACVSLCSGAAEDGAGDWMLRGVMRLPVDAPNWGGRVVMSAAWQSYVASRQEKEDQPPSPTLMSPTTPAAVAKKDPDLLGLGASAVAAVRTSTTTPSLPNARGRMRARHTHAHTLVRLLPSPPPDDRTSVSFSLVCIDRVATPAQLQRPRRSSLLRPPLVQRRLPRRRRRLRVARGRRGRARRMRLLTGKVSAILRRKWRPPLL